MRPKPQHFYTFHFDVRYKTPSGVAAQRPHNIIVSQDTTLLPLNTLKSAQMGVLQHMQAQGIGVDDVLMVTHTGTTYHGRMTEPEFTRGIASDEIEPLEDTAEPATTVPPRSTPYDA